ncbi:MAG: ATP-grasp domain-containing protein [Myxococcota bacterium]
MNVLFLSPNYPPEMQQFTRGLAEVGAKVFGVGDTPREALPEHVSRHLAGYLHVPAILDEDDVIRRVTSWLGTTTPDRVEGLWEVVALLAARLRERFGVTGMSVDTVTGFRDKVVMKGRVEAAGLRVPRTQRVRTATEIRAFAASAGFPIIVKPVDGAGGTDTWRIGSPAELEEILPRVRHLPEASVEEFVTGKEFTYETLCVAGRPLFESVSTYFPNVLEARKQEWISPIIYTFRDPTADEFSGGRAMGRAALRALGMGTGMSHMEWFKRPDGEVVFGEIACRPPGANMVDLMNYACDADLFREWARVVVDGRFAADKPRPWNAAIVFKRAKGEGKIRGVEGLESFVRRFRPWIARVDLLPIGAPRRDWTRTFLADGNVVVRHPDPAVCLEMAQDAAATIHLYAS